MKKVYEEDDYKSQGSSETTEQIALASYLEWQGLLFIHVPNESKRSRWYGTMLKRMGMKAGFPDIFIFEPRGKYHGMAIEMKYGKGKQTMSQKDWELALTARGYAYFVCYSFDDAVAVLKKYMRGTL